MDIDSENIEIFLNSNTKWTEMYFLKHATVNLINKWLLNHGYPTIKDPCQLQPVTDCICRNQLANLNLSPVPTRTNTSSFFGNKTDLSRNPSVSRRYLRTDFAKCKLSTMFRTHEPGQDLANKRSSMKGMRQFHSLPSSSAAALSALIQSRVNLPRYDTKDELMKKELKQTDIKRFFLEIVKDVSHHLDIKSLSNVILVNVCLLLDAERSYFFFVDATEKMIWTTTFFDMCTGSRCFTLGPDNKVYIPWGEGIVGQVAITQNTENSRLPSQILALNEEYQLADVKTLLAMPIKNSDNQVIAVVLVVNKETGDAFDAEDEKDLEMYLAFCGMAFTNARAIDAYTKEFDRNKTVLEVVHYLFEEQTSVEDIVTRIMKKARSLLDCERCVVTLYINNEDNYEQEPSMQTFITFDLSTTAEGTDTLKSVKSVKSIPESRTNELLNCQQQDDDGSHQPHFLQGSNGHVARKTHVLIKAIRNNKYKKIGEAKLLNKQNGLPFNEDDDKLFEVFCIYCGLGINNCLLYDQLARSAARQAVAIEVLAYHALAPIEMAYEYKEMPILDAAKFHLADFDFCDYFLTPDEMVMGAVRIFSDCGLTELFKIDNTTLIRWLLTVRKNYRAIPYHNWRHAFNVCQFMFALLTTGGFSQFLSPQECLALIVACLCHDLDHRGTNNAFQEKSCSPLAQLYGTQATLEQHHFNHAVMILQSEGHNILADFSSTAYASVMKLLKHAILSTDLSLHLQVRQTFSPLVTSGKYNWNDDSHRELLRSILMTACDLASVGKPWDVQKKAAILVVTEFFNQGDMEKSLFKADPNPLMDREKHGELPKLQVGWIEGICLPLYQSLVNLNPALKSFLDNVKENRDRWQELDNERHSNDRLPFKETDL